MFQIHPRLGDSYAGLALLSLTAEGLFAKNN